MSETVNLTKRTVFLFILMLIIAVILACYNWYEKQHAYKPVPIPKDIAGKNGVILDGKQVPLSDELQKFVEEEGYLSMMLVNSDGKIKLVELGEGKDIEPCGLIVGTKITGNCDLSGQPTNFNQILISRFVRNPSCNRIQIGGVVYTYHDGNDNFPKYSWWCDAAGLHSH